MSETGVLIDRLRSSLQAAHGNLQIRERLRAMLAEPGRFEQIVRELGGRHSLIRDLRAFARSGERTEDAA